MDHQQDIGGDSAGGYSHTLARLLKEEQQDKQRVLPVFLTSNGPGVLWSDTNPNAAHTTWQLDRDGDVWTIRLLSRPYLQMMLLLRRLS